MTTRNPRTGRFISQKAHFIFLIGSRSMPSASLSMTAAQEATLITREMLCSAS